MKLLVAGTVLALAMQPRAASAETRLTPISGLGTNAFHSFVGWNTAFHVAAVGATAALVTSGADHEASKYFRQHDSWGPTGAVGYVLGYTAPTVGTVLFYVTGRLQQRDETVVASYAVMQSTAIAITTITALKLVTGRAPPEDFDHDSTHDARQSFRFGLYRGGIIDGWPSGHTAMLTTIAATLAGYYRRSSVTLIGFAVAAYTGFSMVAYDGGSHHWLSDVVAGALVSFPIGWTVGRSFRDRFDGEQPKARAWTLTPLAARGTLGLSLAVAL